MQNIIKILITLSFLFSFGYTSDIYINKVLIEAKQNNKQILFFFHINNCPYCERMLDENFKDKEVIKEIKKSFIVVDIHADRAGAVRYRDFKGSKKEFAKYIGAVAYPTTLFMDENRKIVHYTIGYRNIDEFLSELKYVGTKSYKTTNLETFTEDLEFKKDD